MRPHANAIVALLLPVLACGTDPVGDALYDGGPDPLPDASHDAGGDAAGDDTPWTDVRGADGGVVTPGGPEPLAACEVATAWENQSLAQWMEPSFLAVSPNRGLVWTGHYGEWSATLTRVRDGEVIATSAARDAVALDAAWSRRVVLGGDGRLTVATTVTDETLAVLQEAPDDWTSRWHAAAMSPDGHRVVAAGCVDTTFRVQLWEVDPTPRVLAVHDEPYEGDFCQTYDSRAKLVLAGDVVFYAQSALPRVKRWDWTTNEITTAVGSDPPPTVDSWPWRAEALALALSPDGTRLAVSGSDGHLRMFDAADLSLVWDVSGDIGAAPVLLNQMTYAPAISSSPIAWSPGGGLLATLGPDSGVVLRDPVDGGIVRELPARTTEPDPTFGIPDAVAALVFSHDGASLFSLQMHGQLAYTCEGSAPYVPSPTDPIEVTIDGPARVTAGTGGTTATFTATHLGHVSVHAHRFYVDGEPRGPGEFERTAQIFFDTPGEYEVSAVIDDGVQTATASMRVFVE